MNIYTEKKAERFLQDNKFSVVKSVFVRNEERLKSSLRKLKFPVVMKVSGSKIIHKNKIKGVIVGISNYDEVRESFKKLKKIKGFEEMIIQPEIHGEEFLIGIKKTPEFGHSIVFGAGGVYTEKLNDVSFRVCDITKQDAREMISEVKAGKNLKNIERDKIINNLLKLCKLVEKYPFIKELDINPLIVKGATAKVVDARIVWSESQKN
ncbi:MAG: acetate--CoA ligase family protein [Nanoarchaeota archaeon]|nr:acetate--CoA ligase family protein [Nanoarchaeota archaeon]